MSLNRLTLAVRSTGEQFVCQHDAVGNNKVMTAIEGTTTPTA